MLIAIWNGFVRLLRAWFSLFAVPFSNPSVLWIIIPLVLTWIATELFQEKKRTSFGNAISNGVVVIWIGIDWLRYLTGLLSSQEIVMNGITIGKFFFSGIVLLYGISIVYFGIKAKEFVHVYGRIRETTYFLLMFTPIIYGIIKPSVLVIISIFIFFPVFYFLVEILTKILPDSKAVKDAMGEDLGDDGLTGKTHDDDMDSFMKGLDADLSLDSNSSSNDVISSSLPQRQPVMNSIPRQNQPKTNFVQRPPQNNSVPQRPPYPSRYPPNPNSNPNRTPYQSRRLDDLDDEEEYFKIL